MPELQQNLDRAARVQDLELQWRHQLKQDALLNNYEVPPTPGRGIKAPSTNARGCFACIISPAWPCASVTTEISTSRMGLAKHSCLRRGRACKPMRMKNHHAFQQPMLSGGTAESTATASSPRWRGGSGASHVVPVGTLRSSRDLRKGPGDADMANVARGRVVLTPQPGGPPDVPEKPMNGRRQSDDRRKDVVAMSAWHSSPRGSRRSPALGAARVPPAKLRSTPYLCNVVAALHCIACLYAPVNNTRSAALSSRRRCDMALPLSAPQKLHPLNRDFARHLATEVRLALCPTGGVTPRRWPPRRAQQCRLPTTPPPWA